MALSLADASTDKIDHASGSTLDDQTQITLAIHLNARDVNNAFRDAGGKGTNFQIFRRGVDGTRVGFLRVGTSTASVDIATGNMTTGENFIAFTMNFGTSIAAYWGNKTTLVSDKSFGAAAGSGSLTSDAGSNFILGDYLAATTAVPWDISWIGWWNRVLTLDELIAVQYAPIPTANCVLACHYGYFAAGSSQPDYTGNGNNGTVTGATVVNHSSLIAEPFGRRHRKQAYVVAPPPAVAPRRSHFLFWFPPVTK